MAMVEKGNGEPLWVAHNEIINDHSDCIVQKGLCRMARKEK